MTTTIRPPLSSYIRVLILCPRPNTVAGSSMIKTKAYLSLQSTEETSIGRILSAALLSVGKKDPSLSI